jgi:hypothetical protein
MLKARDAIRPIQPTSFLSRVSRQARNYSTLVGWLLYRAFKGRASKLVLAIALSLVHLGGQAAAIYAVYWYGQQMQKSGLVSLPFFNFEVNLKDQPEWLWAVVAFSMVCFVISATFLYLSRRQLLDLVEQHFARSVEQLVLLSLRLPDPRARLASKLLMDFGVPGLTLGCRRGAMTAISFANAITAVVGGFGAAIFLLRIDPALTLLILVSVGLAALLLYPLTLRAVQGAKDREKSQTAFKMEVRKLTEERIVDQTVASVKTANEMARGWIGRRRVLTELVFAIEIGTTVILGIVIYYMATEALAGREQWAIFLAYIAALRMTLTGVAQSVRAFASVSRFYPQIVRYYLFIKDSPGLDAGRFAKIVLGDAVILGALRNGQDVIVNAGECLALVTIGSKRELKFALLDARLANSNLPVATIDFDPAHISASHMGVALIAASELDKDGKQCRAIIDGPLKDNVTLIVHQQTDTAGAFGEKYVLTLMEGEFCRFAAVRSEECDAALKEFSLEAAVKKQRKTGQFDDDEEEDEE